MAEDSDSFPNFPPFELPKGITSFLRAWDLKVEECLNAGPMTTKNKTIRGLPSRGKKAGSDKFRTQASAGSTAWIGRGSSVERGVGVHLRSFLQADFLGVTMEGWFQWWFKSTETFHQGLCSLHVSDQWSERFSSVLWVKMKHSLHVNFPNELFLFLCSIINQPLTSSTTSKKGTVLFIIIISMLVSWLWGRVSQWFLGTQGTDGFVSFCSL